MVRASTREMQFFSRWRFGNVTEANVASTSEFNASCGMTEDQRRTKKFLHGALARLASVLADPCEAASEAKRWEADARQAKDSARNQRFWLAIIVNMADVTQILSQLESGDGSSAEQLLLVVYDELRKLASARLSREKPGQTLQTTALVHEAYVRLVDVQNPQSWRSRGHFFSAAAEAMRRILIDQARRKGRIRHGGGRVRVDLQDWVPAVDSDADELLDLDDALHRFAKKDPQTAELVKLRLFAGLTNEECASVLDMPASTAKKHWMYARSWLRREMAVDGNSSP